MAIIGVSPDPRENVEALQRTLTADVRLLADEQGRVLKRYGLLNNKSRRLLPHPTTLVIDRAGAVRWRFTEVNHRVRPTNEQIRAELRSLLDN